jgi:hypothetical protein
MRRIGGVWDEITSFANLMHAARRAAAGKRWQRGVAAFLERLEPNVLALQRRLRGGDWRPGTPTTFAIRDPKPRTITAAPFADRVVHHALIDVLEPHLDRRMAPCSFACRRGMGQHRALRQAQRLVRRWPWFLQIDIARCFPSMRHDVVLAALARRLKDRAALALCATIVRAGGDAGVGLPIGNLTSQWLANLVLDGLDHWLLGEQRVAGCVRYMDDVVVFAPQRDELAALRPRIDGWLAAHGLAVKEAAARLWPSRAGLPFLGFVVHAGMLRLRPQNARRSRKRLGQRLWQWRTGQIDDAQYAASAASTIAHLRHGATLQLRRAWFFPDKRPRVEGPLNRCNRGGSFDNDPDNARSDNRNNNDATNRNDNLGACPAKTSVRQIPEDAPAAPPGRARGCPDPGPGWH